MSALTGPFSRTYRYLQRQAHENPVIFYSVVIGTIGPLMTVTILPLRERLGYRQSEMIPQTYPIPNRPRRQVQGYEDP
ncbi:hypothetical protein HYPSUDRAFT_133079 [Hypholoma sublateritium FD-334 SS-4]|uniref:NADH-ubiquinone oxidoreductase 9.5 kDa subunit n=1 Tax=Hypholoma sublateritium (strain FD-334 SS-4) TaxID=945553 RepID=A0A0D2MQL3_HYPSF|nr:hypothetical protein HYPSUDRAFT_133079 [Hypholoma sublateritium FD-334 SS-4]